MGRAKQLIAYNPYEIPPSVQWDLEVHLSRERVPELCEQLLAMTSERRGASYFYPGDPERTTCRFEWHRRWRRQEFALRVLLFLDVGDGRDLERIWVYVARGSAFEDSSQGAPDLTEAELGRLVKHVEESVAMALGRCDSTQWSTHHLVFHAKVPPYRTVGELVRTRDSVVTVYPSKVQNGERMSAVGLSVRAATETAAEAPALRQLHLLYALLTLASRQVFASASPKWSRKDRFVRGLPDPEDADQARLYPEGSLDVPPEERDVRFTDRLRWVWERYHLLDEGEAERFSSALFAYHTGLDSYRTSSDRGTIATVAFVAALGALAADRVQKCNGDLACSKCGGLGGFRHNLVGDRVAVVALASEVLGFTPGSDERRALNKLMGRVYGGQRSSFVHAAVLRHEEFHQGQGLPHAFPTPSSPTREVYQYKKDAITLENVCRHVLLGWLAGHDGGSVDHKLFDLNDLRLEWDFKYESRVSIFSAHSRRLVQLLPGLPPDSS
jgi:hypothetical protein